MVALDPTEALLFRGVDELYRGGAEFTVDPFELLSDQFDLCRHEQQLVDGALFFAAIVDDQRSGDVVQADRRSPRGIHADRSEGGFDLALRKKTAGKLCEDLLYKADFMVTSDDPKVKDTLLQIENIPQMSEACRDQKAALQAKAQEKGLL